MKNSPILLVYHPYRYVRLQTISVSIFTIFILSFVLLSQTIISSYIYATSNKSDGGASTSPSQPLSNNDNDNTDTPDENSNQGLTTGEDKKEDPSTDSLQTLSGNLFEEKPIDGTLVQPPIQGVEEFPPNTDLYTTNGYLTIETRAVNYTPEMKQTIDSVSVCVQTRFLSEDNLVYSVPANPNCSIGVDTKVTYTVHPGQVILSITNVGAKFTTYEKDCLITIGPAESKSCGISFIGNPVLMELEDRPLDIDIIKK
jgi:hypothetical protein